MIASLLIAMLLHPVHETVSEVEWNPKTLRMEVALRMSLLDEQWVESSSAKNPKTSAWATEYLRKRFVIDPPSEPGDQRKRSANRYHWIGRQEIGSHVWWYFEIEPITKTRPLKISQQVLLERDESYVNRVVLLEGKSRTAIVLSAARPIAPLPFEK